MDNKNTYINYQRAKTLLTALVAIDSPYFSERQIMEYVHQWLTDRDLPAAYHHYQDDVITHYHGINVIGQIDGNQTGPKVLINGHLDTVVQCEGWDGNPLIARIDNNKLYGLGALDMKAGCTAALLAIEAFNSCAKQFNGSLLYHFVSDEEGPFGLGTDALLRDGYADSADLAIVPEPSAAFTAKPFPCLCLGARGGYTFTVEVTGKAAHAANPHLGKCAIEAAAKIMLALKKSPMNSDPKLGKGDIAILAIEGGGAICSVADKASFTAFRHIVRGETKQTVIDEVDKAATNAGVTLSYRVVFRQSPTLDSDGFMPYVIDREHPYTQAFIDTIESTCQKTVSIDYFNSIGDFNYLGSRLKIPTYVFGPSGKNYHAPNEYVNLDDVVQTAEVIFNYLVTILNA